MVVVRMNPEDICYCVLICRSMIRGIELFYLTLYFIIVNLL